VPPVDHHGSRFVGFRWVSCGFFRVDPDFLLDNYGSFVESCFNQGAADASGVQRSGTPRIPNGNFNR
jgi:hypothetical protein